MKKEKDNSRWLFLGTLIAGISVALYVPEWISGLGESAKKITDGIAYFMASMVVFIFLIRVVENKVADRKSKGKAKHIFYE